LLMHPATGTLIASFSLEVRGEESF
jgi:hypothetical protein